MASMPPLRCVEPADEIAADIEPDDQDRADQAQGREHEQDARAQPLNGERSSGRRADLGLGLRDQAVDGRGETDGQIGILGDQLFRIADQIELLAADGEYCIRAEGERANAPHLIDEEGAQLRIEILRLGVEIIQAPAQLEADHRKARLFADGRGLHQLVDDGGEAALRRLRRPVEHDQCREIAPRSCAPGFGIALARSRRASG